eukprot:TRINITY_DN90612_c0_g1_i1.p1 TRINITY_DN90612_c0_g1~~TRINITY_DN90612_c0_g1_i1.p1  ORF type:complete len:346 (+),score=94.02 TRINITY_DN90612_c0_g1_i1:70-1107(+)
MEQAPRWQPLSARGRGGLRSLFAPLFGSRRTVRAEDAPAAALGEPPAEVSGKETVPLQFQDFSKEWMQVSGQDNYDGFRIEAANAVTKHLQATHTLFLGTQMRPEGYIYQFGPVFQSEDARTMLVARAGLDGSVNGRWIQRFGGTELKVSSNSNLKDPQRNMHEASLEYNGAEWTAAGKLAWQGTVLLGGSFTQRITPSLQLGGDLTFVAINACTIGNLAMRYAGQRDIFSATAQRSPDMKSAAGANLHELRMQYMRKVTDRLQIGSEYRMSSDMESGMSLAYEYIFKSARIQGLLDTEGKVSCSVSDYTGLGFSGMIDYVRGDYKFGVVLHVIPQPEPGQQQPM